MLDCYARNEKYVWIEKFHFTCWSHCNCPTDEAQLWLSGFEYVEHSDPERHVVLNYIGLL